MILEVLPFKRGGFFVDLAASNGFQSSNTYVLEKYFGWNGICIEPNPHFFAQLQKKRKCHLSDAVISDVEEEVQFRIDNGPLGGIVAEDTDNNPRVRGAQFENAVILDRRTTPFATLLENYHAPNIIDYLSLDVEGSEERILRNFDFQKYTFLCMTIERPTPLVNGILRKHHYRFVKNHLFDTFYVHESVQIKRNLPCQPFEQIPPKDW